MIIDDRICGGCAAGYGCVGGCNVAGVQVNGFARCQSQCKVAGYIVSPLNVVFIFAAAARDIRRSCRIGHIETFIDVARDCIALANDRGSR